jgi:branched-chain amino acid transport system ATP-binding protein
MTEAILQLSNVSKSFAELRAVDNVSFDVRQGSITGLIGPNGAGKTTLFNTIAGLYRPDHGRIELRRQRIDGYRPHRIFRAGLARTFQIPRPFAGMSVLENVMLVPLQQTGERFWNNWLRPQQVALEERRQRAKAEQIIEFTDLGRVMHDPARSLSGGQLKLLELARVLMSEPALILLDEPAAGVNPALMRTLIEKIRQLNRQGYSFLIIEHNMDLVMTICDPIVAMAQGRVIFHGDSHAARNDAGLLDAYLGAPGH